MPFIWTSLGFASAMASAEVTLAAACFVAGVGPALWLCSHLIVCGVASGLYLQVHRARQCDLTAYALTWLATLVAGPVGAVMAVVATLALHRHHTDVRRLDAWYERISLSGDVDPVTGLYFNVAMGRAMLTNGALPPVFEVIMNEGTLEDRQRALGLIARQFSPSYAPALRAALVSSEPVIRVQAAAVAVKVRAEIKRALDVAVERSLVHHWDLKHLLDLADDLDAMAQSGLLEDADQLRAVTAVASLTDRAVGVAETGSGPLQRKADLTLELRLRLETALLARGRYHAFRQSRDHGRKDAVEAEASAHG
jgi:hypothetical protein